MKLTGRQLNIYDNNDAAIANCTSCVISIKCGTFETSKRGDGKWRTFEAGRMEWKIRCAWLVSSDTELTSKKNMVGKTFKAKAKTSSEIVAGDVICTECEITATIGSLIKGSFVFQGTGPLS